MNLKKPKKKSKLVHGVGVNDATYEVYIYADINGTKKCTWICPFYVRWRDVLQRCYSDKRKKKSPTYSECYAVEEWHLFSTFRAWMERQDWEGKVLDKDILFLGNKKYGPDTCVFVDARVNSFMLDSKGRRGPQPIGVYHDKVIDKYVARCRSAETNSLEYLGTYSTPEEAHQAWLSRKLEKARLIASQQTDERVAKALIDRYENYIG